MTDSSRRDALAKPIRSRRSVSDPGPSGAVPTTRSRPRPAATCRAGDASRSASPGWCWPAGLGATPNKFGPPQQTSPRPRASTRTGKVRIANACTNPELHWGLKGGGGGSLGVVTRLTLRTHDLPNFFGGVFATIHAQSDAAFRRLVSRLIALYADNLFNPHWGEIVTLRPGNQMDMRMALQHFDP